jgi:hypothetical protein
MCRTARTAALAAVGLVLPSADSSPKAPAARLAQELRVLYREPGTEGERWGWRRALATLPDGSRAPRRAAYRDRADFVAAAAQLMRSPTGDDAPLGAWLLSTVPEARGPEARSLLIGALEHEDARVAFEAVLALSRLGGDEAAAALGGTAMRSASVEVQAAAAWARRRLDGAPVPPPGPLPAGFRRGISWWMSEAKDDGGARSFRELRTLGVSWVSIHTWEPRQRSLHAPDFSPASERVRPRDLAGLVRRAHQAGLRVLYKPHLEMRGGRVLEGRHNEIEMHTEADWQAWFRNYEDYILDHARRAAAAEADMFSVGRELDRTVLHREADWRRLVARVRAVYRGPLTYSANFDTYAGLGFWDALDFIGVSAYFPLSDRDDPPLAELARGWDRALGPLAATARRYARPVLLSEVGYPAVAGAAREPWRERRGPADVWLQARLYEAAFRAVARRPWIEGCFPWLWEGVAEPPFRDASYSIQGKPAAFVLARWYGGPGGGR